MWKRKKFIIIAVVVGLVLVLVGSLAGVALAQEDTTSTQPKTLLARVATILGIDQQEVEDAFAQAQREMQAEALDNYLNSMVEQGKITQEQANQYKTWWQARPETPLPGVKGFGRCFPGGGMRWGGGPARGTLPVQ